MVGIVNPVLPTSPVMVVDMALYGTWYLYSRLREAFPGFTIPGLVP